MMKSLALILTLALCGCQAMRKKTGDGIAKAGQSTGNVGSGILMTAGLNFFTLPIAVLSIPCFIVASPMYYGGNALAGEQPESEPFDL